ncbi:MAG: hypothetical protein Q4D16_02120 [Eubacteriales bacterium]|nr:hypothetical protein [Eubacteriales bacterium]
MNKKIILSAIIPCLMFSNVTAMAKGPVYNVEARESEKNEEIDNFYYDIKDEEVFLDTYFGDEDVVEIKSSYTIEGVKYRTNLSDFHIGLGDTTVKTVILDEGITEVKNSIFAFTDVQNVFFPKSMSIVYDDTLGYLHPKEDNEYIKIYYAGTQDEWEKIFTKYKSKRVRDAIEEKDIGEVGTALADKLNQLIGSGYDSSEFEYYFEASPGDLLQ